MRAGKAEDRLRIPRKRKRRDEGGRESSTPSVVCGALVVALDGAGRALN
jgi:hypothetical protein